MSILFTDLELKATNSEVAEYKVRELRVKWEPGVKLDKVRLYDFTGSKFPQ